MSREFTYFRKYIILKNDYTNIANLNPKGHAKIEVRGVKGIISLNVENCEVGKDYRVCLLKDRDGEVYEQDLGRIITDDRGRSRTNINFNLKDLKSKGFSIDEVDAILIRKGIYVLLGGYIDNDNGTIDRFIKKLIIGEKGESSIEPEEIEENVETEELEEPLELQEPSVEEPPAIEEFHEPEIVEETEAGVEDIEKPEDPVEPEDLEEKSEEIEVTHEEPVTIGVGTTEDVKSTGVEIKEVLKEEPQSEQVEEYQNYQSLEYIRRLNHKNQMTNYILSILRFFPYVQPLKINLHGYSWWRIDDNDTSSCKGFLPYYNYLMSSDYKYPFLNNSTTCLNLIRKYGHYLFGMYKEGRETKYYIYGVPGKFAIEEHPFKGITGFNTWYESTNGIGYWILYIDPMTGKRIYPLNPMVPAY